MKTVNKVLLAIFGIVLPAAALVVELSTGMCADAGFLNPIPTWFHVALVASVPVANLILLVAVGNEKGRDSTWLRALAGFTVVVSAVYAVQFIPLAFFGLVLAALFFWYFLLGLVGLLPCAPLFALATAFILRHRLAKGPGFWRGAFAALAVCCAVFADGGLMAVGVRLARSSDPATSARGVRLCRISSRTDVLQELCRAYSRGMKLSLPRIIVGRKPLSHEEGARIYYRVTGDDPSVALHGWWQRGRGGALHWDWITGGEKVGGELEGLSLKGSAYETTLDKVAGIGYGEWTMTFGNSYCSDREARMRIALPHGAVVSRVTLWVNGEECEAAFGTKGQVRRAYESVVRRNRDPLLVNVCGPDQVQVQCFPVPREGEMKIRIGITVPMDVAADGKSARLPAPAILERNFAVAGDLLGLPETERVVFENALPQQCHYEEDGFAALSGSAILQTAGPGKGWKPKRIAVVLDTSASMADVLPSVLAELGNLPPNAAREYWIVGDETPAEPVAELDGGVKCVGGRPNLRTLINAVISLGARGEPAALVWVHGSQPVEDETGDALAAALNKAENVRLFNVQVNEGPCPLLESLPQSARIVSLTSEVLAARKEGTFGKTAIVASALKSDGWQVSREKVAKSEVPADAPQASKHLGRLWAAEETALLYRPGQPTTLKVTQELALPWHIVTPVTGAVVLESQKQYEDNGLEPVNASSVPTVPEPSSILCLVIAFGVLLGFLALRRRIARRT